MRRCAILCLPALWAGLFAAACAGEGAVEAPLVVHAVLNDTLIDDLRALSADAMEGRLAGRPSGAKARGYLIGRLEEIGLEPLMGKSFAQPFPLHGAAGGLEGVNLLALAKGASRARPAMVVMAHYDHVGVKDGQIFNGADDNASGVAALLAIAASLKADPPQHDVILALVDAEESDFQGSRALVTGLAISQLLPRIALAVNFDMLSRSDRDELFAAGGHHFPWMRARLEAQAARAGLRLRLGHDDPSLGHDDWTGQSDHFAFHEAGVPWVYFGVEDHADYHQPTDDFARVPQDFFQRSAETVAAAIRAFDADLAAIAKDAGR